VAQYRSRVVRHRARREHLVDAVIGSTLGAVGAIVLYAVTLIVLLR
jgi:hypothetical protein